MDLGQRVWDALAERYGSDLRVVIRYRPSDYDVLMRDDVSEEYTDAEVQAIVDATIVDQLGLGRKDSEIKTGQLHGLIRIFDDAWALIWPDGLEKKSGFIVSLERDSPTTELNDLDDVNDYLNEEIDPRLS